jgi:hypothetical protein
LALFYPKVGDFHPKVLDDALSLLSNGFFSHPSGFVKMLGSSLFCA